jgi:hypothetical protein
MIVVIPERIAREGIQTGALEVTSDGHRFTDPAKSDIEIQVVTDDIRPLYWRLDEHNN